MVALKQQSETPLSIKMNGKFKTEADTLCLNANVGRVHDNENNCALFILILTNIKHLTMSGESREPPSPRVPGTQCCGCV